MHPLPQTAEQAAQTPQSRRLCLLVHSAGLFPREVLSLRQHFRGLQQTIGNQAVLRMLSRAEPAVQTKLTVNQPGDQYEQEADLVADQVMRMPEPSLSRKCAKCEEEETQKVQRKEAGAGLAVAPPIVHDVLSAPGEPLDNATRALVEPRFGRDFGDVRVHFDRRVGESAKQIGALAYTFGRDIAFGHGHDPRSSSARPLVAHELAHGIQQSKALDAAPREKSKSQEGSASEIARPVAGANRAPSPVLHCASQVQRFGSAEHVKIGDLAEPGQMDAISGYGTVRLGEMIAMAGDYFESLSQIEDLAKQGQFGKQQIDLVRWKVNNSAGPKPNVGPGVEEVVQTRYADLTTRNQTHLSTGGTPGNSNKERSIDLHTQAIQAAYLAGGLTGGKTQAFPAHIPEALEGFAEHFLTDAFSAGHVRTPRGELQTYWNAKYPDFKTHLVEFISCNMATYIKDVDKPKKAGVELSVERIKNGAHLA
jgi:hypothetical protein